MHLPTVHGDEIEHPRRLRQPPAIDDVEMQWVRLTASAKRPAQHVAGSQPALAIALLVIYNAWAKEENLEPFSVGKKCSH